MSWDYAELSHAAKGYGGPEGLLTAIHDGGLAEGRIQGGVFAGLLALATGGIALLINRTLERKRTRAVAAKAILLRKLDSEDPEKDRLSGEGSQFGANDLNLD